MGEKAYTAAEARLSRRPVLILLTVALLGFVLVIYQTRFGPGASGDSTSYLMGAENLFLGNGFSRYSGGYELRPITGFPPLYSAVLAPWGGLSVSYMTAARWLNALFFAGSLFLVGRLLLGYSDSIIFALAGQALVLGRDVILGWHTWIMSEPLFILLMLTSIWTLVRLIEGGHSWLAIAAGMLIALATLTRYAGASLLIAAVASILLLEFAPPRKRVLDAVFLGLAGFVPVAAWLARNVDSEGTLTNRALALHAVDPDLVRLFLADMSSWFVPHSVPLPTVIRAILALAFPLALVAFLARRLSVDRNGWKGIISIKPAGGARFRQLVWVLVASLGAYLAVLVANSLLLDASTSASAVPRYLAPAYVLAVVLVVAVASDFVRGGTSRPLAVALAGYWLVLVALNGSSLVPRLRDPLPTLGYVGLTYRWPADVKLLRSFPNESAILSNNPELIYILAGRPAYARPISFDHYQESEREDYEQQLAESMARMERGGVLVVFAPLEQDDKAFIDYARLDLLFETENASYYGKDVR